MFTGKALFYSLRGVICTIQRDRRVNFVKSQEAFHVRVSNDGRQWSNSILRVNYDSLCKNCRSNGYCLKKVQFINKE